MKNRILFIMKCQFILTASLYTCTYLIKTFVIWEFTNPFRWILNMPSYDWETRGGILMFAFFYYLISIMALTESTKKAEENVTTR